MVCMASPTLWTRGSSQHTNSTENNATMGISSTTHTSHSRLKK